MRRKRSTPWIHRWSRPVIGAIALEDDELMFAYQGTPDATGKFAWKEQFFDGAPHQVVVDVLPRSGVNPKYKTKTLGQI